MTDTAEVPAPDTPLDPSISGGSETTSDSATVQGLPTTSSGPPTLPGPIGVGASSGPPPGYGWALPPWASPPPQRGRLGSAVHSVVFAWAIAGLLALAVVGMAVALGMSGGGPASSRVVVPFPGSPITPSPGGSPGEPGNVGLVVGSVGSVGSGSFTVTTVAGGTVTVDEQSSTVYDLGGASASSSAVVPGARVLVQGTRQGNTLTADRVIVLRIGTSGGGSSGL